MTDDGGRDGFAERVYQPAEDSALLADAAREVIEGGERVLDVGTGSGYVAAHAVEIGAEAIGVDVNPYACEQAYAKGIDVIRGDLTSAFQSEKFDVVAFNPPYLPTASDEGERKGSDDWMDRALSGGETGREVIEPFLDRVSRVLRPEGVVIMLVSSLTDLDAVEAYAREAGFDSERVAEESHFFEHLVVLKLVERET